jgi:hypothetical protein
MDLSETAKPEIITAVPGVINQQCSRCEFSAPEKVAPVLTVVNQ